MPLSLLVPLWAAAIAAAPHLTAVRTSKPPSIDGSVGDAVWSAAPASSSFTQKLPSDGAAPVERTTVRVLYDDAALYVAIDCQQTKVPVVARLTRRDRNVESDEVAVSIDTRG